MGVQDKFENKSEELKGRAKEAAGALTGNDELKNDGKADQASSSVKRGIEKVKDGANKVVEKLTDDN